MRKLLAIFLLVFLPMQLSWAAVASYCQHEALAEATHVGHHEHQHITADDGHGSPEPVKTLGEDPDCASCHAGCASALPQKRVIVPGLDSSLDTATYKVTPTSPPLERLERPQWRALA